MNETLCLDSGPVLPPLVLQRPGTKIDNIIIIFLLQSPIHVLKVVTLAKSTLQISGNKIPKWLNPFFQPLTQTYTSTTNGISEQDT